jgi:hypothetical protein
MLSPKDPLLNFSLFQPHWQHIRCTNPVWLEYLQTKPLYYSAQIFQAGLENNGSDLHSHHSTTLPPVGFAEIAKKLTMAQKSHFAHRYRRQFFKYYNYRAAPQLQTEEAFLQYLTMRLLYLYLPLGQQLRVYVRSTIQGEAIESYSSKICHRAICFDHEYGGTLQLFTPVSQHEYSSEHTVIAAFPGTSSRRGRDLLLFNAPIGLRSDLDPNGIGVLAFRKNKEKWMRLLAPYLEKKQKIIFSGYSLGGIMATRLYASLNPEQQRRCRLITFNAPGIDITTAKQLLYPKNIRMVRHLFDVLTQFGEYQPPGTVFYGSSPPLSDFKMPHRIPEIARAELDGKSLSCIRSYYQKDYKVQAHPSFEYTRSILSRLFHSIMPA